MKKIIKQFYPYALVFVLIIFVSTIYWRVQKDFNSHKIAPTKEEIFNQEESLYFVIAYVDEEYTNKLIKSIREIKSVFSTTFDKNGLENSEEGFSTESYINEKGIKYIFNEKNELFEPDIGYYLVDLNKYPVLYKEWEIEYHPEYKVIRTTEETLKLPKDEQEKELLYQSVGYKTAEFLYDELIYVIEYGIPSNPYEEQIKVDDVFISYVTVNIDKADSGKEHDTLNLFFMIYATEEGEYSIDTSYFYINSYYEEENYEFPLNPEIIEFEGGHKNAKIINVKFKCPKDTRTIFARYQPEGTEEKAEFKIRIK